MSIGLNGSNEYLYTSSTPISGEPFSMGCWFYSNGTDGDNILALGDKDSPNHYFLIDARFLASNYIRTVTYDGGYKITNSGTGVLTANTWHHALLTCPDANSRSIHLDGGNKGTNSSTVAVANLDRLMIGAGITGSYAFANYIAEVAVWNAALTDAEAAILAKGFSPLFVRPQNLVEYYPLIRSYTPKKGTLTLTENNTPYAADHPRIIYPSLPRIIPFVASGGTEYNVSASAGLNLSTSDSSIADFVAAVTAAMNAGNSAVVTIDMPVSAEGGIGLTGSDTQNADRLGPAQVGITLSASPGNVADYAVSVPAAIDLTGNVQAVLNLPVTAAGGISLGIDVTGETGNVVTGSAAAGLSVSASVSELLDAAVNAVTGISIGTDVLNTAELKAALTASLMAALDVSSIADIPVTISVSALLGESAAEIGAITPILTFTVKTRRSHVLDSREEFDVKRKPRGFNLDL